MKLIIDIPEQWRDDMVWEKFDKVDELCQVILDGDIIPDNATNKDAFFKVFGLDGWKKLIKYRNSVEDLNKWLNEPYQKGGEE